MASSVGNGFDVQNVQKAFHSPQHYYENFSECDVMTMFDILAYLSQLMTAFTSHLALFWLWFLKTDQSS